MEEIDREWYMKDALELINEDQNVNLNVVDQEWDGDSILELLNRKPADISAKLESQCDSDGPYSVNRSNNQNSTLNKISEAAPVNYMDSASILHSANPLLGQQPHANATFSSTGPVNVSKLQTEGCTLTVIETYNEGSLCTSQEIDKMDDPMESGAEPRSVPHVGVAHETWQPGLNNDVPSTSAPPPLPSSKRPRKVTKPSRVTDPMPPSKRPRRKAVAVKPIQDVAAANNIEPEENQRSDKPHAESSRKAREKKKQKNEAANSELIAKMQRLHVLQQECAALTQYRDTVAA